MWVYAQKTGHKSDRYGNLPVLVEQEGWALQRTTGSHHIYENPEVEKILSIPVHRNQDLKVGTLKALMKIAQLSEEDLL
ncbi:type II toxin-antitoxin system HicA family toxin [Nostoc punctiforme]|uniref:type II toxin-antitoxin system HicA family toxin n=1 Tax=Nostoc punctiforme TaxID=272131 RepID=UPI0030EBEC7A